MAADFTIMDHVSTFRLSYFRKYLGVTYFIRLIGQAGLDSTDDQIDGTKKLFESYEELLIMSYSNSQRKKFVVFVDS